jgi:putative ABC transport system permease protein
MDSFVSDLRYGLRLLRKSPGFASVTILTLALGIGANTAIYSVVDAVLVRPLPYADPDRLVMVWEDASDLSFPRNTPAPGNYFSWKAMNRVFADIAATRGASANLTLGGPPEQIVGRRVTANFFSVLGVEPVVGRTFTEAEDQEGAAVTVISYGLWQRRYGGDPNIIGSELMMNGSRRTIVGVMPRGFVFRSREIDFWNPIQFTPAETTLRGSHFLNVVARLSPGVTLEQAREDMQDVARRLAAEYPTTNARVGSVVIPVKEDVLGDRGLQLVVLMAAAGCVLLIACANIASLLLSRGMARRHETAVRAALGATGGRLATQMVIESLILALAGGTLGVLLAPVGMTVLASLVPDGLLPSTASMLDVRLFGFAIALALATGLLFSVVPAAQSVRASIGHALQQGGRTRIGGRSFARDLLVVAQVATALVLLVSAGLLVRTLENLRSIDLGFKPEHLVTMRTTLPTPTYQDPTARLAFYERVVAGITSLPGVVGAAYVNTLPFQSVGNTSGYSIEGREVAQGQDSLFRVGTSDYLRTIGVELVEGRLLQEDDGRDAPPVVVINETFAKAHWPGESPLGHRVRYGGPTQPWRTIVGVVKDVRERGYELAMKPGSYIPYAQNLTSWFPEHLIVRTNGDPVTIVQAVRRIVAGIDPDQPIAAVRTMQNIVDLDVADRNDQTRLVGAFAVLALLLASIGLYGVLSFGVAQRAREIGLRMALGASSGSVTRLVIARGLGLTALGVAIGLTLATLVTRILGALLYGVAATDPMTYLGVVGLLAVVSLAACSLPALRAARVDPMDVLRQD